MLEASGPDALRFQVHFTATWQLVGPIRLFQKLGDHISQKRIKKGSNTFKLYQFKCSVFVSLFVVSFFSFHFFSFHFFHFVPDIRNAGLYAMRLSVTSWLPLVVQCLCSSGSFSFLDELQLAEFSLGLASSFTPDLVNLQELVRDLMAAQVRILLWLRVSGESADAIKSLQSPIATPTKRLSAGAPLPPARIASRKSLAKSRERCSQGLKGSSWPATTKIGRCQVIWNWERHPMGWGAWRSWRRRSGKEGAKRKVGTKIL